MAIIFFALATNGYSQVMVEWSGQFKWGSGSGNHITKYWVPMVEKEVKNGNLKSFKSLGHAMGDEWNSVDLYVAENYATWEKAWDNIISGWRDNTPQEELIKNKINLSMPTYRTKTMKGRPTKKERRDMEKIKSKFGEI